jgi:hypothetical protein
MNEPSAQSENEHGPETYRSYLLRLWRGNRSGGTGWRASLEDPHSGERIGFGNLEQLFAFLMERAGADAGQAPTRPNNSEGGGER